MGVIQSRVTPEFKKWVGYCEKDSKKQLGVYDKPENYVYGAGNKNYTIFADLYREKTGINVQGQPWCDSFFDTIFIHLFGVEKAQKMLGGFSAYTPTSANFYKKAGRYFQTPQEGDQIFFHNGTRIYHTGYVYSVKNGMQYTIEGNTSSDKVLENEGGCVAYKKYPIGWKSGNKRIDGYGRPDYSIIESCYEGFMRAADNKRWWYQFPDGTYASNGWFWLTEKTGGTSGFYLFDKNGYMLTGYQSAPNGKQYFLCPDDGIHEGKCMITSETGELLIPNGYDFEKNKFTL